MDYSKLPKFSNTARPDEPAPPPTGGGPDIRRQDDLPAREPNPPPPTPYASPGGYCLQCGLPLRGGARFCDACGAKTTGGGGSIGSGAEAWLSIAMGAILLVMSPRLLQYVISPSTFPAKWIFKDEQGAPLAYTKSLYFFGDVAITSFALLLIVEGAVLFFARRAGVLMLAMGLTIAVTLLNLVYVIMMMNKGYGMQLFSIIAVAFGVYIAIQQWTTMKMLRAQ